MFRVPDTKSDCYRQGEAEVCILDFKTTLVRVSSPPQSRSKAVVCASTPRMYPRSWYFLVSTYVRIVMFGVYHCVSALNCKRKKLEMDKKLGIHLSMNIEK